MSLFDVRTQNRQTVIESALDCFIKDGIEDTKIAYIARCAGLTERSVYRYFENKADLVLQAALFFWDDNIRKVEAISHDHGKPETGLDEIRDILLSYGEIYFFARKKLVFVWEAELYLNKCGKGSLVMNKPPDAFKNSKAPLACAIRRGLNDGSVNPNVDVEMLYYNSFDALLGFMQRMAISENDDTDAQRISARKRIRSICLVLASSFENRNICSKEQLK